jgi:hypothetical protein
LIPVIVAKYTMHGDSCLFQLFEHERRHKIPAVNDGPGAPLGYVLDGLPCIPNMVMCVAHDGQYHGLFLLFTKSYVPFPELSLAKGANRMKLFYK